jgi:hypothetical protein
MQWKKDVKRQITDHSITLSTLYYPYIQHPLGGTQNPAFFGGFINISI